MNSDLISSEKILICSSFLWKLTIQRRKILHFEREICFLRPLMPLVVFIFLIASLSRYFNNFASFQFNSHYGYPILYLDHDSVISFVFNIRVPIKTILLFLTQLHLCVCHKALTNLSYIMVNSLNLRIITKLFFKHLCSISCI